MYRHGFRDDSRQKYLMGIMHMKSLDNLLNPMHSLWVIFNHHNPKKMHLWNTFFIKYYTLILLEHIYAIVQKKEKKREKRQCVAMLIYATPLYYLQWCAYF